MSANKDRRKIDDPMDRKRGEDPEQRNRSDEENFETDQRPRQGEKPRDEAARAGQGKGGTNK